MLKAKKHKHSNEIRARANHLITRGRDCLLYTSLEIRKEKAYGVQHDYFDHPDYIGWTREGDNEHLQSGIAVVISNSFDGEKRMYIGKDLVGEKFVDALSNCEEIVEIDQEGWNF